MWNDIIHSWDTFLPRKAAQDFIFYFLNCVLCKVAKPDQKLYGDPNATVVIITPSSKPLLFLPFPGLLDVSGPCPQLIDPDSRVGHVTPASTNQYNPNNCIFRGEYDSIKANETQGEIGWELPEHGDFFIWKRKQVNLVANLQPWQQPALSSGRWCRRQSRDGKKRNKSPQGSQGLMDQTIPEAGLPLALLVMQGNNPFYYLSCFELGVLLHGIKSNLSDAGKDHVYLCHST